MREPTIRDILFTAEGIRNKPINVESDWDLTFEAVQALHDLVLFRDMPGNRCFCDGGGDPPRPQHTRACLNAQEVLRRADYLLGGEA